MLRFQSMRNLLILLFLFLFTHASQLFAAANSSDYKIKAFVYYDRNEDGFRSFDEWGVGGVRVIANEKSCITDVEGVCTIVWENDQIQKEKIKYIRGEFSSKVLYETFHYTTDNRFEFPMYPGVVELQGGIAYDENQKYAFVPDKLKLAVQAGFVFKKFRVAGNPNSKELKINFKPVKLPKVDVTLFAPELVFYKDNPLHFNIEVTNNEDVKKWIFEIINKHGEEVYKKERIGETPKLLRWNCKDMSGKPVPANLQLYYRLYVKYKNYTEIWTKTKSLIFAARRFAKVDIKKGKVKFKPNVEALLKKLKPAIKQHPATKFVFRGTPLAVKTLLPLAEEILDLSPSRIVYYTAHHKTNLDALIEVMLAPPKEDLAFDNKIKVDGKILQPFSDGSFHCVLHDVPLSRPIQVDMMAEDGYRLITYAASSEASAFKDFDRKHYIYEFPKVVDKNEFVFEYGVSGKYPNGYKLLSWRGTFLKNNYVKIRLMPELGLSKIPFKLITPENRTFDIYYLVKSRVIESDDKSKLLKLYLPLNLEELNHRKLFFRGMINPSHKLYINGVPQRVEEDGYFYHLETIDGFKHPINLSLKYGKDKEEKYTIVAKVRRVSIQERMKLLFSLYSSYLQVSQTTGGSIEPFKSSNIKSLGFRVRMFPFYMWSRSATTLWDSLGFEIAYERGLFPFKAESKNGVDKKTAHGPEWASVHLHYDVPYKFSFIETSAQVGYRRYLLEFKNTNSFTAVAMQFKPFVGINLSSNRSRFTFALKSFYCFPMKNITAYGAKASAALLFKKNISLQLSYRYEKYKKDLNSEAVEESLSGPQVSIKWKY